MALPRVENTVVLHLIFVVALGFALFACRVLIEPTKAWVPCSDPTISFPFKPETISTTHIIAYICLFPPLVILIIEFLRWRLDETDWFPVGACTLFGLRVPKLVQCLYLSIGNFLYGSALTMITVEFGKKTVGRLRPHFFEACKATNLQEICDPSRLNQFVYDVKCSNLKNEITARESFPSAHSAATFYIAVFLLFYLQSRMSWPSNLLPILRPTVQMIFVQIAFVVGLTRVRDHYHHYSDVAVGALIGTICAIITVFYMSPLMGSCSTCRTRTRSRVLGSATAAASDQSSVSSEAPSSHAASKKEPHSEMSFEARHSTGLDVRTLRLPSRLGMDPGGRKDISNAC
ncbi:phospholipid phosphatase 2 [Galendromus occidentalis]|uniref:Phospholipid phosphatase 2 n=1 Tax=Galendromus occidentalis TaxID=34638 RepID=A0AAJ6VUY1_9ACAR|nr:phospholipid phosphatase 2 [Galendromus occidentalis]